ncbi:MAG: endonuclease, partial [Firmicutes bacterium]|nr:endonuclease [Bacillota bacterium]
MIERIIAAVGEAMSCGECTVLLEGGAGAGDSNVTIYEEMARLLAGLADAKARVGVCLDTAHLFAAGYDIRTPAGADAVLA